MRAEEEEGGGEEEEGGEGIGGVGIGGVGSRRRGGGGTTGIFVIYSYFTICTKLYGPAAMKLIKYVL